MFRTALIRYNFRVLMFHNWWLLVIPLAVSQLTVFWTASTQRFIAPLPATIVESVSPLLAAFLCAHLLAPEYRSGIGAVLASKPVHIGKVVLLRLTLVMALVWVLEFLSLAAFYFGLQPYPLLAPALAGMVSSLFLGLFALTFATMLRQPLAGFGIAALYWLLDLPPGPPINPYLSLKSLTSSFPPLIGLPKQPLTDSWWIAKVLLLIAAFALYFLHGKLLFTLGSPLTLRRRHRALGWAGGIVAFYMISGACVKVVYAYENQAHLFPSDVAWLRRQFAPFGPIPVAALFGPNFRRYLGDIPNSWRIQEDSSETDLLGETAQHQRDVQRLLKEAPNSIWAPGAADLMARFGIQREAVFENKIARYQVLLDRYPTSPYTPYAVYEIGHLYAEATPSDPTCEPKARAAYETLLSRYSTPEYNAEALGFLTQSDRRHHDYVQGERHAQQWIDSAPVYEKFMAWIAMAEIRHDEGKIDAARQAAHQALLAIGEYRRAAVAGTVPLTATRKARVEADAVVAARRARQF
jgi:hypothetical protein